MHFMIYNNSFRSMDGFFTATLLHDQLNLWMLYMVLYLLRTFSITFVFCVTRYLVSEVSTSLYCLLGYGLCVT